MTMADAPNNKVIGVIAPFPPPYGGMSVQAQKLVSSLAREGCTVRAISTNPEPPRGLGWCSKVPGLRTFARELQYLILLATELPGCDIIHHFSASWFYFFAHSAPVLVFGRMLRKRVVLNYRGGSAPAFLRQWRPFVLPLLRLADTLAVPSEFLVRTFGEHGVRAVLLPNLADTESFVWKDRLQFTPRLLVTRRLEPMYNLECVLRAFRIVQRQYPDASLTIAGDGSEERRLRQLAQAWGLLGVEFRGAVPHHILPTLYCEHDICVNASNIDNFPGALVEAACCGLPIVSTRAGGIPCMVSDRRSAILADLNDHEALARGVIEVLQKPEFGRALALEARLWAEQFSWPRVWGQLQRCYWIVADHRSLAVADSRQTAGMEHNEMVR
jgi:glycosyltransferase involved in cell wall biosynthesis